MTHKIIFTILISMFSLSLLCSCGKDDIDYFSKGYAQVENGQYKAALESFLIAAEQGDDQAKKAADIVSGYLNADEAFAIGDIEAAKAFLESIPENYEYYDIAEDIDSLRRKVYSYNPDAKHEDEPTEKPKKEEDDTSASMTKEEFSRHEQIDLDLQQVQEYIDKENYTDAQEYLSGLDFSEMSDSQRTKAESMKDTISQKIENASSQDNEKDFTSEKAIEFVQREYSLQGDMGGDLPAKYDEDGRKYYELTFQDGTDENAPIITVHIYGDGEIKEVDRR